MRRSLRRLNRATLARQHLLRRERLPLVGAVRRVMALLAQRTIDVYAAGT